MKTRSVLLCCCIAFAAALPARAEMNIAWSEMKDDRELRGLFVKHSQLKDPGSVQFRNVRAGTCQAANNNKVTVKSWCGEVNAKNSYGAYTGFRTFNVFYTDDDHKAFVSIEPVKREDMDIYRMLAEPVCKGSGVRF